MTPRSFFAIAPFASTLLVGSAASAAITIVRPESLPRLDAAGNPVAKRALTLQPEGINRLDCDSDQRIRFPLTTTEDGADGHLEVWASLDGTDCSPAPSRTGTGATCWPLALSLAPTADVVADIAVRDLLSGAPPFSPSARGEQPCGVVDLVALSVQFLYFPQGQVTPTESATVTLNADTVPPAAPTGVRALPAEGRAEMKVAWAGVSDALTPGIVKAYCAKATAEAPVCGAFQIEGDVPDQAFDERYLCATGADGSAASTSITLVSDTEGPLEGGARYTFALATVDTFANVSTLSDAVCDVVPTATVTSDDDGGCAVSRSRSPSPLALVAAVVVVARRRRRS